MSKTLTRLAFSLWILGAPLVMIGCSEGDKGAATPPATTGTEAAPATPAPAPGAGTETTPAPSTTTTPPAESAPAK